MGDHHSIPAPGPSYVVFRITGRGYAVLDPSRRQVSDITTNRSAAQQQCDRLNAALDRRLKRGPRPCMSCGHTFQSAGIHNRLCDICRRRDVAPDPVLQSVRAVATSRARERR